MLIPGDKRVVCLTGNVWSKERAFDPRRVLLEHGFRQPNWFTTGLPTTAEGVYSIMPGDFRLGKLEDRILAHIDLGGDTFGIAKSALEEALTTAKEGALIVGPQDIVAQVADAIRKTVVFTIKSENMELSPHLEEANKRGQVHRIDVDITAVRAWDKVNDSIFETLGLAR